MDTVTLAIGWITRNGVVIARAWHTTAKAVCSWDLASKANLAVLAKLTGVLFRTDAVLNPADWLEDFAISGEGWYAAC